MRLSENKKVNEFLEDIRAMSLSKFEIIESIRDIFNSINQDLVEDVKYGGVVFSLSNTLIGGVFPHKEHVSIEFSNGAELSDPEGMLEGKGKKRRHLKITGLQDIENKNVRFYIEKAINN